MSVYSMMYIGVGPLGAVVAGFVADGLGARWTILVGALICLAGSAIFALELPAIRPAARKLIQEQRTARAGPESSLTVALR